MRRRIVLFASGTALLAVVLLAIPLGVLAGRGYLRDERLELQQAAATAAAQARGDITTTAPPRVEGSEIHLSVYDRAGRLLYGPGASTAGPLVRAALTGRQASDTAADAISVTAPVSDGDQVVAALLLTTNLDAVHQRTLHAWLALAAMCLTAVLLSALGAGLLARRLTRPVDRLTTVAGRIGRGDLTARGKPSGVTEIDALAATLNDSVERIQTMIARERAFSAEVSHQLRTPLSGLRLELEAARDKLFSDTSAGGHSPDDDSKPAAAKGVSRALHAVDRLETTIADVISLARDLPAGQRLELSGLLNDTVHRWHGPLARSNRPLRVLTDPGTPDHLHISRAAASQILDILIDNACRHGRGAVAVQIRAVENTVAIEVSDEGPPLTKEAWQLFHRRSGTAVESGEHGLGLPYARRLAEAESARLVLATNDPPTFALITIARGRARP